MNDFTKEELVIIKALCNAHKSEIMKNSPLKYLAEKIESMIDNYCDDKNSYNKGINLIEHAINNLLPVDCEASMLLFEALICIDGADHE